MALTRVWNITSDPSTDVPVQNLMVLGKLLKPGQSMQIDEKDLEKAHKTKKDVSLQLLAIGKTLPSYLAAKAKATLPADLPRGHGQVPAEAMAADVAAKVDEKVVVTESVAAETKPAEDASTDESRKFKHNRR